MGGAEVFYFPGDSMARSSFSPSPLGDYHQPGAPCFPKLASVAIRSQARTRGSLHFSLRCLLLILKIVRAATPKNSPASSKVRHFCFISTSIRGSFCRRSWRKYPRGSSYLHRGRGHSRHLGATSQPWSGGCSSSRGRVSPEGLTMYIDMINPPPGRPVRHLVAPP